MRYTGKKRRQYFLSLLLCTCLLGQFSIYPVWANDRSADIIGSHPLLVPNVITPIGLSGQGQMVGIADSGLDDGSMTDIHPDLQGEAGTIPKVMLQTYTDRELADDPDGHGTFMAATIAGTGKASQGKFQGIAPGASLYFQALLDKNGNLSLPDKLSDLFMPAYSAGVRIHVNGWGGGSNIYTDNSAEIDKFVYWHPEFLSVFGAGNSGPGRGTLTSEANSKNALVIGSSQVPRPAFDPESRFADEVADSSSRGPTGDGRIKPDLLAPGSALISACSSLAESNFAANSLYTRMGGSSMATAVTGGALALLREQLNIQNNLANPSAALLKALLINGARSQDEISVGQGFGILDSAGTALALKEGTFQFSDNKNKLKEGETREYKLQVADPTMPIKVTLAWADPPGNSGKNPVLMNDLNLYVQDASGKRYYGNDFNNQGKIDNINNIEQVSIKVPQPGEYTIVVRASKVSSGEGQDFALVYGQTLKTGVVNKVNKNQLLLVDGTLVDLNSIMMQQVLDGVLVNSGTTVQEGSEIYLKTDKAYVFGQSWKTGGIQALPTLEGDLLLEMNNTVREGGYYLDPQAEARDGSIMVNGLPVSSIVQIPLGSELKAAVNPVLQTLWKLEAFNQEVSGFVAQVDPATRKLKLLNDSKIYKLASWAAISYHDKIVDCTAQDTPYSTAEKNDIEKLLPGTAVTMQVSPQSSVVQALFLERPLVIGRAAQINPAEEKIELDTGRTYKLFPGSIIYRDKAPMGLGDIKIGDRIMAQLLPDSSTIIQLQAFSDVYYGRVVYASPQKSTLYIIDSNNRSHTYTFNKQTEVYGMGIQMETSSLASGNWVRVISDPDGQEAWRIDVAEIGEESIKTLSSCDCVSKTLRMDDGTEYTYNSSTRISKGGYRMNIDDIVAGEKVQITTLLAPSPWPRLLAGVEVNIPAAMNKPELSLTARSLNGVLIIQGSTSADRLYLYRQDGSHERIEITRGNFSRIYNLLDNETDITMAALDMKTGAMRDVNVKINAYPNGSTAFGFTDISGHWAEKFITQLAQRNIVKGYEDGSFRPNKTISRAELIVLIAQLHQLSTADMPVNTHFIDEHDIPWWALHQVLAARQTGLVNGYPDGSFRPCQAVTRSELAIIFSHLQKEEVVNLFPGEALQPNRLITRAEAAAILARL